MVTQTVFKNKMRGPFRMIYCFVQMSGINSMSRKSWKTIYIYIILSFVDSLVRSFVHCLFEDVGNSDYKR
jgi:hypothetical protein